MSFSIVTSPSVSATSSGDQSTTARRRRAPTIPLAGAVIVAVSAIGTLFGWVALFRWLISLMS